MGTQDLSALSIQERIEKIAHLIGGGAVGVTPTDTVYGLTGDARSQTAFDQICAMKLRRQPCTIIPPSRAWAREQVAASAHKIFDRHYDELVLGEVSHTCLFPVAEESTLPPDLIATGLIGFRVPKHWLVDVARHASVPLLTTSVNKTGEPPMTTPEGLDTDIAAGCNFVVFDGPCSGSPSTLVFLDGSEPRFVGRGGR